MLTAGDFKNGVTFEMDGKVYQVIEFQHVNPGKGAAFVRTKYKDVMSGTIREISLSVNFDARKEFINKNFWVNVKSMDLSAIESAITELTGDDKLFNFIKLFRGIFRFIHKAFKLVSYVFNFSQSRLKSLRINCQ